VPALPLAGLSHITLVMMNGNRLQEKEMRRQPRVEMDSTPGLQRNNSRRTLCILYRTA